jgi:hypothetical protein
MDDPVNEDRVQQIRRKLEERDTEDLITIWQKNDRDEWTPEAFVAIREILISRTGKIPEQTGRLPTDQQTAANEEISEEADTYYDKQNMLRIASYAKNLAVLVAILFGLILIWGVISLFLAVFSTSSTAPSVFVPLSVVVASVIYCGFFWIVLQLIGEGVYILMDIEENTRQPGKNNGKSTPQ